MKNEMEKIYIAGKITNYSEYKGKFKEDKEVLEKEGFIVLNPSILPTGFEQEQYLHICRAMIDVCDYVYFLNNWMSSCGARKEMEYSMSKKKIIIYQA